MRILTKKEVQTLQEGNTVELGFEEAFDGTGEFLMNANRQIKKALINIGKVSIGLSIYIPDDAIDIEKKGNVLIRQVFF